MKRLLPGFEESDRIEVVAGSSHPESGDVIF